MRLQAFAKINLDLRILGRREDGYHELKTIFQAVDWCDELELEPAGARARRGEPFASHTAGRIGGG